jgi:hypothetical protein
VCNDVHVGMRNARLMRLDLVTAWCWLVQPGTLSARLVATVVLQRHTAGAVAKSSWEVAGMVCSLQEWPAASTFTVDRCAVFRAWL